MSKDFGHIGNELTRYAPTKSTQHPKEGGFDHYVTTVYETPKGRRVTLRGIKGDDRPCKSWKLTPVRTVDEECRKTIHTMVRGRSKTGNVNASCKVERFIRTQGPMDEKIDAPKVAAPLPIQGFTHRGRAARVRPLRHALGR